MDGFVAQFEKTKMKIERLKEIDSEISRWEREGKTKGLDKHIQFIRWNSTNLDLFDDVMREYHKLLGLIEGKG